MVKDKVIRWTILACQWSIPWISEQFKDTNDRHTVSFTNMHVSLTNWNQCIGQWCALYHSLICGISHWYAWIADRSWYQVTDLLVLLSKSLYHLPVCLYRSPIHGVSDQYTFIAHMKNLACSRTINDQISNEDETWLCDCKPHGDALPERANSCDCQPKVKGKRKAQGIRRSKREAVCSRPPPSYQNGPPYVLWHYKSSVSSFSTFCHEWIVIPRREDVATGKQLFTFLSPWLTELRKHKIRIPSEMAQNLMILHSYILVKVSPDRKIDAFV